MPESRRMISIIFMIEAMARVSPSPAWFQADHEKANPAKVVYNKESASGLSPCPMCLSKSKYNQDNQLPVTPAHANAPRFHKRQPPNADVKWNPPPQPGGRRRK